MQTMQTNADLIRSRPYPLDSEARHVLKTLPM